MNELFEKLDPKYIPWLVFLLACIAGVFVSFLLIRLIKMVARKKDWLFIKVWSRNLTNVLYFFIPLVFLTVAAKYYILKGVDLEWVYGTLKVLLIAVTTWLMTRIVIIIEKALLEQFDLGIEDNNYARKMYTKIKFIKRIVVIAIILIGVSVLLLSFESVRQYGIGILTSAGIFSVIIGFAAQKSLANLLAGIQIAFTQPIKIDDVVIVEGEWGRIEEINITYVVVNIWDMRRLVLPITYFIEKPFQNWTRNESSLIGAAFLHVNYNTPVQKLRDKLGEILQETPLWDGKSWALQVTDTQQQFMILRAIMSAKNSSNAFDLRCYVRERLIEYIVAEIPEALPGLRIDNIDDDFPQLRGN